MCEICAHGADLICMLFPSWVWSNHKIFAYWLKCTRAGLKHLSVDFSIEKVFLFVYIVELCFKNSMHSVTVSCILTELLSLTFYCVINVLDMQQVND